MPRATVAAKKQALVPAVAESLLEQVQARVWAMCPQELLQMAPMVCPQVEQVIEVWGLQAAPATQMVA